MLGKWATPEEQKWAPTGTHFHQFVVPPIAETRKDCSYGKLAAMQVPKDMRGMRTCEVNRLLTMDALTIVFSGLIGHLSLSPCHQQSTTKHILIWGILGLNHLHLI